MASHSWCQILPLSQSCIMSSGILGPSSADVATPLTTPIVQLETPQAMEPYIVHVLWLSRGPLGFSTTEKH